MEVDDDKATALEPIRIEMICALCKFCLGVETKTDELQEAVDAAYKEATTQGMASLLGFNELARRRFACWICARCSGDVLQALSHQFGPGTKNVPTGAGDFDEVCNGCGEVVLEAHSWAACCAAQRAHVEKLSSIVATHQHYAEEAQAELAELLDIDALVGKCEHDRVLYAEDGQAVENATRDVISTVLEDIASPLAKERQELSEKRVHINKLLAYCATIESSCEAQSAMRADAVARHEAARDEVTKLRTEMNDIFAKTPNEAVGYWYAEAKRHERDATAKRWIRMPHSETGDTIALHLDMDPCVTCNVATHPRIRGRQPIIDSRVCTNCWKEWGCYPAIVAAPEAIPPR